MGLDNPLHILVVVVALLLIFGARRLPEIGRSLGSGMREFKDSISGESKPPALTAAQQQPQPPAAQPAAAQPPAAQPAAQPPAAQPAVAAPPTQAPPPDAPH